MFQKKSLRNWEKKPEDGTTGKCTEVGRLRESAEVQGWMPVKVQYKSMEKFLCDLELVR